MADINRTQGSQVPTSTQTKLKDMGDGTHAEVIYVGDIGLTSDDITGAQAVIPTEHYEVHEGETFQSSYKSPDDGAIADNASLEILLQTGSAYPHMTFSVAAGGDCEVLFYEDTTTSDVGTALVENNMQRYSTNVATLTATHTPTVSGVGTLLHNSFEPGGRGPQAPGGTGRSNTEWVLDINTVYLVRATNRAGTAQPMSIVVQWYEESTA
jgi:hypothetical protein